jgi:hypothetical protein
MKQTVWEGIEDEMLEMQYESYVLARQLYKKALDGKNAFLFVT